MTTQEVGTAPGKEREREPLYGGDLANLGPADAPAAEGATENGEGEGVTAKTEEGMVVDGNAGMSTSKFMCFAREGDGWLAEWLLLCMATSSLL